MTPLARRLVYILTCTIILMFWISVGHFEAIEAPYVRF